MSSRGLTKLAWNGITTTGAILFANQPSRAPKANLALLEAAIRRAYPTQIFDELDVDTADLHFSQARLATLLEAVTVELRLPAVIELEVVKSHVLHVGLEEYPSWEDFNRTLPPRERVTLLARHGPILYWNILLSRFGPFWSGYWNVFQVRNGRVIPEISQAGDSSAWYAVRNGVTSKLAEFGLLEVDQQLLDTTISWLRVHDDHGTAHQKGRAGPSVYDALFSDIY